jgi:HlyD family secretion protein
MTRVMLALFIASVVLTGCTRTPPTSGTTTAANPAAAVSVVHPQKKALPKVIEQPGTVQPYESTPLYAKLAGFVKKVNVDIGDLVEGPTESGPGTVLAELSIPELVDEGREKDALVERARAEVEQAKKLLEIAEANIAVADAQIAEAKAGLKRAQATLKRWESEATRVAEMVRTKALDPQTGAETENQLRSAEAARDEAQARATVAEKGAVKAAAELGKAKEDVKAAEARQKVAEADAARLQSLLDYRFLRAPFAGVVTRRGVDTGHFAQPAGTGKSEALFTVVRLDTVRVPVDVPEADAALVTKGVKAKVSIPALKGVEFAGEVKRTAEALDPGSRTLRVEIDLPNPDRKLRPGQYVNASITAPMPEAWVLPANAVVKQADQTVCFLYSDGKAVRLPIQPGRTDGTWTEVFRKQKSGVPGAWEDWTGREDVLSGPAATLTDGQAVSVGAK